MKKNIRFIIPVLFLFNVLNAQQPAFIKDSLDAYVNRELKRWNLPGAAIAIVKDGDVIVSKGYGVADVTSQKPVDGNTLFMIASNTKLFTGTSLAMLQEEGKLSLNDPVKNYLPYFKMYNDTLTGMVTIEDILSHRLGFETFQGDFFNWANNVSREDIIKNISKNKPVYDFRDTWGYCNAGFVTAGEIVKAVSDTSWEDFIQARFFNPLEMKRSSVKHEAIAADKNACSPYTIFQNNLVKLNYDNLDNIAPCAAINSCTNDLSHWLIMQLNNGSYKNKQVISAGAINETRMPRSIVGDGHSRLFKTKHFDLYGLGIEINDYEGREIFTHTGGADGFVTAVCFIPEENLGIAVLTNSDANYFFLACMYQIIESYFDLPYRNISSTYYGFYSGNEKATNTEIEGFYAAAEKYNMPSADMKNFIGTYQNDVYGKMEIKLVNQKPVMYFEHHPQLSGILQATDDHTFVCTYDPISWGVKEIPFTIENGKVISATISVNDFIDFGTYEFIRL